jgi:hypothetical protein
MGELRDKSLQVENAGAAPALEKHYRVKDLAELWSLCENTIIHLFANEPGVLRVRRPGGKRAALSVPQSVVLRVHERLGQNSFEPALAGGNPLRVIRLRDLDGGVPKKPRNVLKLHAAKKPSNRECVT